MMLPVEYRRPVHGFSADCVDSFKRMGTPYARQAALKLEQAVKFSFGDDAMIKDLVRHADVGGKIRLPFDLMAIEIHWQTGQDVIMLYEALGKNSVQVFTFVRGLESYAGWAVSDWVRVVCEGTERSFSLVDPDPLRSFAPELRVDPEKALSSAIEIACTSMQALDALVALTECTNVLVETVEAPAKQAKGLGKRKRQRFRFDYKVLLVESERRVYERRGDGSHDSPRLHLRRGHIRRLPSGKKTWVRSCLVGSPENGVAIRDYLVPLP